MKPIFVSTILQRDWPSANGEDQPSGIDSNKSGLSIEDYNEAITWMAHRYGCIVLDAYGESGITMGTMKYYSDDGLHLNTAGGNQYADYIWGIIEEYLR